MTNKKNLRRGSRMALRYGGIMTAALLALLLGIQSASAAITSSLDFGAQGAQVTELQTYLAANPSLYPSGLVTGYFGPLTQAGVQRFQAEQGIVSNGTPETTGYGRVGPQTMARLNAVMGGSPQTFGDPAPIISSPFVRFGRTDATFTWSTNEPSQGQVYWDASPLRSDEATGPRQQPYVSGALAADAGGLQTSHQVVVSNLQPNTLYYYLVRGIDANGNLSMTWPTTFRTDQ